MMGKLESVQYSAALAVTGAWTGTSQDKLYSELAWESLGSRRWSRRLILFYNLTPDYTRNPISLFVLSISRRLILFYNLTPDYTRNPISLFVLSIIQNPSIVKHIASRTESFKSSFYPGSLSEWNKLDPTLRDSSSVNVFKKKVFSIIRPPAKSVYGIHDPTGVAYLTQLRVGLSKLNCHTFKHNFTDTINPMCQVNMCQNTFCCSAILSKSRYILSSLVSTMLLQLMNIL